MATAGARHRGGGRRWEAARVASPRPPAGRSGAYARRRTEAAAGKHGAGAEAAPRVRFGRSSREASRAWTGWPPSLSLSRSAGGGGKEAAGAEEGEGRGGGVGRERERGGGREMEGEGRTRGRRAEAVR